MYVCSNCTSMEFYYMHFLFCRGNYVGQLPYTVGEACSNCPPEANNCVDGLCCKFMVTTIHYTIHTTL